MSKKPEFEIQDVLAVEMNSNPLPQEKCRELRDNHPRILWRIFYSWVEYVRASYKESGSDVRFFLFRIETERKSKIKKQMVRKFRSVLRYLREKFTHSSRFLHSPKFVPERDKHWPKMGLTRDKLVELSRKAGRKESLFLPNITPTDIEDLYYACAMTQFVEWMNNGIPSKIYIDFGHEVGFTAGEPVEYIRIDIGDLSTIHGIPDDARDRKGHPTYLIDEIIFENDSWSRSFKTKCVGYK